MRRRLDFSKAKFAHGPGGWVVYPAGARPRPRGRRRKRAKAAVVKAANVVVNPKIELPPPSAPPREATIQPVVLPPKVQPAFDGKVWFVEGTDLEAATLPELRLKLPEGVELDLGAGGRAAA